MSHHQNGFSLIEVLISLFLLSTLILGFNKMMLQLKLEINSLLNVYVALQQQTQIQEQLLTNSNTNINITEWNRQNARVLPNGKGELQTHHGATQIILRWALGNNIKCNESFNKYCLSVTFPTA